MCDKFPSIEQFRHFLKELDHIRNRTSPTAAATTAALPSHYHLTGTVKLHGTHGDILVTRREEAKEKAGSTTNGSGKWQYAYQSRTRVVTAQDDNMGFAAYMSAIPACHMDELVHAIERVYTTSPSAFTSSTESNASPPPMRSLLIAGEWCGRGIQSGVALDRLPRMFVLCALKVNDTWQPITRYQHVTATLEAAHHRVYTILRVPAYHVTVSYDALQTGEALAQLQVLTDAVEQHCPYGASFGVSGTGEGIVWVCDELLHDSRGWFKVKGDKHAVTRLPATGVKDSSDAVKARLQSSAVLFATEAVTEARLLQGVEHLRETHRPLTKASMGEYMRWVQQDTAKEEGDSVAELGLDAKAVARAVGARAVEWYQRRLQHLAGATGSEAKATSAPAI